MMLPKTGKADDFRFKEMDYTPEQTTFQLFAPVKAKTIKVRIYKDGQGGRPMKTVAMKRTYSTDPDENGDVWKVTVKGDHLGRFYTFDTGNGETPGVFAKAVGVNGQRGAIINDMKTWPDDWCCDQHPIIKSPADLVVYELHHRDFSIGNPDAKYPGKFLALTEPWAIDHLTKLGVNAIHLLPSYDFGSIDETRLDLPQYNWGYDPVNYNVPEGSYSTDPFNPVTRILEFKQMVQALHKAGIAVILDVVYNHTYDIEHSNFQRTFPDYYYRKTTDKAGNKVYSNGSGCGNETASERRMMRQFIVESAKYWYNEYRVDGFRFDLMGVHDIETMNAVRAELSKLDPSIIIYGEGWSAGTCALPTEKLAMKANIAQMPGIAAFSDELRDALRGPFSDDTKSGWLGGRLAGDKLSEATESIKFGIVGAISHPQVDLSKVNYSDKAWANEPTQMVSYVSCHDDMCLTDRMRASIDSITDDELIRLDLLAQTAVMTSQGMPFMLSGEELLRTKLGVHNSYCSPDSVNRLDWGNAKRYPQVLNYYRSLIQLRHNHPAFRLGDAHLVRKHLEFLEAPAGVVAYRLKDYAGRDDWRNIIVILNSNRTAQQVPIPKGMYTVVCQDGEINEQSTTKIFGRKATVSPQSALIIHD